MAEYIKKLPSILEKLFLYSVHHWMIEMTESKRSEDEVISIIADIINARMTEEIRRIFEVLLVFADNVRKFKKR